MKIYSSQSDDVGQIWDEQISRTNGYSSTLSIEQLKRFARSPYIQLIKKYSRLNPGALVLEPGCGSAKFSFVFASQGYKVMTLDYSSAILNSVADNQKRLLSKLTHKLELNRGDLEHLPYADDSFDLVMNEGVVEHWLEKEARIRIYTEMIRVTKPGGKVAIIVPNGVHPLIKAWDDTILKNAPPMTYYSPNRLKSDLMEAGLEQIETDGIYPFRSWLRLWWWKKLYYVGAALDKVMPVPKALREKWAINLIALSTKRI